MTQPIRPDEVVRKKTESIPAQVIESFNDLIAKKWDGRQSTFTQHDVMVVVLHLLPDVTREEVYERRWLDIEDTYRASGWTVVYDRPGYNEDYPATFTFKRRRR